MKPGRRPGPHSEAADRKNKKPPLSRWLGIDRAEPVSGLLLPRALLVAIALQALAALVLIHLQMALLFQVAHCESGGMEVIGRWKVCVDRASWDTECKAQNFRGDADRPRQPATRRWKWVKTTSAETAAGSSPSRTATARR